MQVTIKDGIFRVETEVTRTTIVEQKDEMDKVVDKFSFGIGDGAIANDKLIGNIVNGKITYIAKVDTEDLPKAKADLKKLYGKALARAAAFENAAVTQCAAAKAAEEAEQAAIDALFN